MTPRSARVSSGISGSITEATISCAEETVVAATVTTPLPGAPERRSAFRQEEVPAPRCAVRHVRRRNRRNVKAALPFRPHGGPGQEQRRTPAEQYADPLRRQLLPKRVR